MAEKSEKLKILDKYCNFAKKKGFHPSRSDLINMGISRDKVRHYFGSATKLRNIAKEYNPKALDGIVDDSLFNHKTFKYLVDQTEKFSRYLVSTAVAGCKVHDGFMSAINNYNKKKKSMTLVLPAMDPAANVPFHLDPKLADTPIVVDDLALNDNIFVSSIRLSAKHIDPITGLSRVGQRNGSFIYASPKQRLKMTSTSNTKPPHALMTTGSLTKPDYSTNRYMSERTAYIADNDHILGGVIVEIQDYEIFHYRQVQADQRGNFVDLGVMYMADGTTKPMRPEALVLGDWHSGETDPNARKALLEGPDSVVAITKPKRLIIHDGFNGLSISHHEINNKILRAKRAADNQLSLEAELDQYAKDLDFLTSLPGIEEVIIVKSNHDEFLDRYLSEGRYIEDPQNHRLAVALAGAMLEGDNPLKTYVDAKKLKNGHKLIWLERDEDYTIAKIELGSHGDKGANGSRGSIKGMEEAFGNSVSGHAHTPEILRGAWQVGTTSLLKLEYNKGPSSWMHTSCLVYPNGSRQLINVINKAWRLKD